MNDDDVVIVFTSAYGSRGDIAPVLRCAEAYASRARARGSNARVCAVSNAKYADDVTKCAFASIGKAEEYDGFMMPNAKRGRALVEYWLSHLREHWEVVLGVIGDAKRAVVVGHALDFVVRLIEESKEQGLLFKNVDVTCATVVLSPAMVRGRKRRTPPYANEIVPPWAPFRSEACDFLIDCAFAPKVNAFRAELGMKTPKCVRGVFREWFMASHVLALYPAWFERVDPPRRRGRVIETHQFDFPCDTRDVGGDETVKRIIEFFGYGDEAALVFVSASGNPPFAAKFFDVAARCMARLGGARAIVLTKHTDRLGVLPLPPNVLHIEFVDLLALFRAMNRANRRPIVVHHCGVGVCASGLIGGALHVAVPAAFDQPYNANILRDMGVAAEVISMSRLSRKRLTRALLNVFEKSSLMSLRADEIVRAFASSAPTDTVTLVADFIARRLLARE